MIDVTGELVMHPDKKVGLALGILLIGITGAFFFRNDASGPAQDTLTLTDPESLDRKASQKPGAPYFPERSTDDNEERPELADVPDSSASDVIPGLPRVGPTGYQGMLAEPINVAASDSGEQFADRMAPLPTPGQDLDSLENVLSRNADGRRDDRYLDVSPVASGENDGGLASPSANQAGDGSSDSQPAFITHEVVAGDNLSRIAKQYLGSHSKYLTLYEANRDVLASPDDLSLGMKLKIPRKSAGTKKPSSKGSASSSTSTKASSTSAAAKNRKKPSFVQPDRAAVIALGGGRRPGRSLSQAPPPNLPRVEGLNPGGDPAVIASRPK
ncbi:MAG: LysM peptidoglycan-binding domain-containing protein [Planctomycetales bacterium]|jgi:nucleoid-associated protein YgaU